MDTLYRYAKSMQGPVPCDALPVHRPVPEAAAEPSPSDSRPETGREGTPCARAGHRGFFGCLPFFAGKGSACYDGWDSTAS